MQEPPAPSSVGHVNAQEMKNFAASVKEIQPINQHVQAICSVPDDYIDSRRYPLLYARRILREQNREKE